MKTIGLIGGMSWESTVPYYQIINECIKDKLGGFHSAKVILYSVDFAEIEECQTQGLWEKSGDILTDAALALERAGADFIVIATNTMHKIVPQMEKRIHVPVLHICDVTASALKSDGVKTVALLGTKYTMTQNFYKDRISSNGIRVITPDGEDIDTVNNIIYNELCLGKILDASRKQYSKIISGLRARGAEAVILGCTEIGLLVRGENSPIPVYDTTRIHAIAAAMEAVR